MVDWECVCLHLEYLMAFHGCSGGGMGVTVGIGRGFIVDGFTGIVEYNCTWN